MAKRGKLESRFTVPTGGWSLTVTEAGGGTDTATVAAGDYYLSSGEVAGGDSFCDVLAAALNAAASLTADYTVAVSAGEAGTGKVTITASGGSVTAIAIAWDDTDMRDLLGFSGSEAAALAVTGERHARALWLPDCVPQALNSSPWPGVYESDIQARESASGEVYVAAGEVKVALEELRWPAVSQARTWKYSEALQNESFERFWLDCIIGRANWAQPGGPIRYHADADDDAGYWTYRATGPQSFRPDQIKANWAGKFAVQMARWVLLPSEVDKNPLGTPPVAGFVASIEGTVATLTDTSSDSDNEVVAWSGEWGDGATFSGPGPWAHDYGEVGAFSASLTVADSRGLRDSTSQLIEIPLATYAASGAEMATMMGISAPPDFLARFDAATSPVPDLAGADDSVDDVRSGVATADAVRLGDCAYLAESSAYWARFSDTTKLDVSTGSFAVVLVAELPTTVGGTRTWVGKTTGGNNPGWAIQVSPGWVNFVTADGTTSEAVRCDLDYAARGPLVITATFSRTTGAQRLFVNETFGAGFDLPAGSLSNASKASIGSYAGLSLSPEQYLGLMAFWSGAGAEEVDQAAHNALRAAMGLAVTGPVQVSVYQGQSNAAGAAEYASIADATYQGAHAEIRRALQGECGATYPAACSTLTTWTDLADATDYGEFGPWLSAAIDMDAAQPTSRHRVIIAATGGTDIGTDWDPDADSGRALWPRAVSFTDGLLGDLADEELVAWTWWQGEEDAINGTTSGYQAALQAYYDAVRAHYGTGFPFIVVKLGSWQTFLDPTNLAAVRAAQEAFVAANDDAFIVDTDAYGASTGDNLHADAATQIRVGQDIAAIVATFHGWGA